MNNDFNEMNLHPQLVQAVTELGYEQPTAIQAAVIPLMLAGEDVLGQAQTGTGKTAAFALPILHQLDANHGGVQTLVLAPTRELAMQVARTMHEYGRHLGVRVLPIYGGQSYDMQIRRLKRGVDVVVGTPGRLLDLMGQNALDLSRIQTLVIDEADEMLTMGFIEDVEAILAATPTARQTALFSATLPAEIRRLANKYMSNPQSVTIEQAQRTVDTIEERYYLLNEQDKLAALTRLFEMEAITSALIFTRTRADTGYVANELTNRGFPAEPINGDLSQDARERVLARFRDGKMTVLVATDVAARGLDIDDISHVFNYDLPQYPETYVHRVGRTGRAGRSGIAITLVTPREQWRLRRIEAYTKHKIAQCTLPTVEEIQAKRGAALVERMMVWLRRGRCAQEREMVEQLVEEGYDVVEIAAAALKIARADEKMRPIEPISALEVERPRQKAAGNSRRRSNERDSKSGRSRNRSHEEGMVRLLMSVGKSHGIRPSDVVGSIAYHADIPGKSIGSIQIEDQQTWVDVPEQFVPRVLAKNVRYQIRRRPVKLERA